ncbi:MAG TPA: family 16 glycoside hydrolase, partial [Vicinamibacterales bacterium]
MRELCYFAVGILLVGSFAHLDLRGQQRRARRGASKNFVPDSTFAGSSLSGWRTIGEAAWRADNGEIIATPKSGGWLMLDRPYEDVAVVASFRCADACRTGVLLRAEQTADGGSKGIFVSLSGQDLASYRIALDSRGNETSRERLRSPGGGQLR